jgi:hypothetical protein
VDRQELQAALDRRFGADRAERRVVARQVLDLADSGKHELDRGTPLTVAIVLDDLEDAPAGSSLAERWNWWLGALEVAYGGYREFQVVAVPDDASAGDDPPGE